MSVLAPPAPAPMEAQPAPPSRPAHETSRQVLVLGVVLALVLVGIVAVVFASFGGSFSSYATVEAELPMSSTAVALNSPVEYRNVQVGTVASQGQAVSGGLVEVTVHLQPSLLASIPSGVRATVTPVSLFGNAYIVLVPPAHIGAAHLQAGAVVPPLENAKTASLQSTLGDLDTLLVRLHPAMLDAALTAVAGALQGQGTSLGHNLVRGNNYFTQMLPLWPTFVSDLHLLVPVTSQFAASTPQLLQIIANQTTTGHTVTSEAPTLRQAIGGGATLAAEAAALLADIEQPYDVLAADSGPFLQDLAQNPTEISSLLAGLDAWARAWSAAESSGPYLDLRTDVVVANPADLGLAVLGGPQAVQYLSDGLGSGYVNPPTYTSAGTIAAPSAPSAPSATSATSASSASSAQAGLLAALSQAAPPLLPAAAQAGAVSEIVDALGGGPTSAPGAASLLLTPLLESLARG